MWKSLWSLWQSIGLHRCWTGWAMTMILLKLILTCHAEAVHHCVPGRTRNWKTLKRPAKQWRQRWQRSRPILILTVSCPFEEYKTEAITFEFSVTIDNYYTAAHQHLHKSSSVARGADHCTDICMYPHVWQQECFAVAEHKILRKTRVKTKSGGPREKRPLTEEQRKQLSAHVDMLAKNR